MSVYTPPQTGPGAGQGASQAQQPYPQPQTPQFEAGQPQHADILKALPYIAALASVLPTGQQAAAQQMQPQLFGIPIEQMIKMARDAPPGSGPKQESPGLNAGDLLIGLARLGAGLAGLATAGASPTGQQAGAQQMQPQLFGIPIEQMIKTARDAPPGSWPKQETPGLNAGDLLIGLARLGAGLAGLATA
ncbi:hypothetical protein, partial [Streptomyces sulfonofaciens]